MVMMKTMTMMAMKMTMTVMMTTKMTMTAVASAVFNDAFRAEMVDEK